MVNTDISKVYLNEYGQIKIRNDGQEVTKPLPKEGLSEGLHIIEFENGRRFAITLPKGFKNGSHYDAAGEKIPMPVLFILHGALDEDPIDFVNEFAMMGSDKIQKPDKYVQKPENETTLIEAGNQNGFAVVEPLAALHKNGEGTNPAYTWVVEDALMSQSVVEKAGPIDDIAYLKGVADVVSQLADSDPRHQYPEHFNWAVIGFSQGGPVAMSLMSERENLFPYAAFVATGLVAKKAIKPGNMLDAIFIDTVGDEVILPNNPKAQPTSFFNRIARATAISVSKGMGLDSIDKAQPKLVTEVLKAGREQTGTTSLDKGRIEISTYKGPQGLTELVKLLDAQHSIPGGGEGGMVGGEKYRGYDGTRKIVEHWKLILDNKIKRDLK